MLRVAFTGGFAATFAPLVEPLLTIPCEIVVVADEADAAARLGGVDVLVTLAFTPALAAAAGPRLKLVQLPAAGLDRVDLAALPADVALANAYGHEAGIAEHVMGAMIALTRGFLGLDAGLRAGEWPGQWAPGRPRSPLSPELAGATLGILGCGHIGAALARRARAFDMEVLAIRRDVARGAGGDATLLGGLEALDGLLARSDHLAVTLSLNAETRGLIGARELSLMKPGARLINVARAEIVDEAALFDALSSGRLAGAALDVWYRYPRDDQPTAPAALPFHTLSNVLMTPHVSGATEGMAAARAAVVAANIERVARGERPVNEVVRP